MAIEDGAALGVLLSNISSIDQISERLTLYNQIRLNRTSAIQAISSVHSFEPEDARRMLAPFFDSDPPCKF